MRLLVGQEKRVRIPSKTTHCDPCRLIRSPSTISSCVRFKPGRFSVQIRGGPSGPIYNSTNSGAQVCGPRKGLEMVKAYSLTDREEKSVTSSSGQKAKPVGSNPMSKDLSVQDRGGASQECLVGLHNYPICVSRVRIPPF